jgi:hypothetical protein
MLVMFGAFDVLNLATKIIISETFGFNSVFSILYWSKAVPQSSPLVPINVEY